MHLQRMYMFMYPTMYGTYYIDKKKVEIYLFSNLKNVRQLTGFVFEFVPH